MMGGMSQPQIKPEIEFLSSQPEYCQSCKHLELWNTQKVTVFWLVMELRISKEQQRRHIYSLKVVACL